jgi:hypothetical protein
VEPGVPTFDFLPLLWWGLPLVAAPIVIHLINLLRHRRVPWAAMEFLLASQKKYRTRVLLKQLLLLALRVLAILGIVLALAQPRWTHAIGQLLGGGRAAHVVLIDDSYSMGERSGAVGGESVTAFERGRAVVERICGELAATRGRQEITIGRFSRLLPPTGDTVAPESGVPAKDAAAGRFDVPRQSVTPESLKRLRDELASMEASASDAGPLGAVAAAAELLGDGGGTNASQVVWLVSDFRAAQWESADDTVAILRQLAAAGSEIRLVDCAAENAAVEAASGPSGNLTLERLVMVGGVPAAGVVVPLEVAVHNDGPRPVRDVTVDLREDGVARPGVRIPEIPAGGEAVQRFDVRFQKSGSHVIEARLPADILPADDARALVVDVVDRVDVLVIDGALADTTPGAASRIGDAFYLSAALAPGAGAPTGLQPRIEPPRALATLDLSTFDAVWVLDVERLDGPEVTALETYARDGGGVVFFVGPRTKPDDFTRTLHRDGAGIFPVPLAGMVDLLPDATEQRPDVVVEEHPVVAVLAGQRNPLLDAVRVDRYAAVERGWEPPAEAGLRRLLSLRNGAPLMVERSYGAGIVAAVLTTASPTWNNWSRGNPSWVVVMLELESHLARGRRRAEALEVGEPVRVALDPSVDGIEVDFLVPPDGTVVHQTALPAASGRMEAVLASSASGAYAVRWRRTDGLEREKVFAVNVDPDEGRLARSGREGLETTLAGVPFTYENAATIDPGLRNVAGVSLVTPLLAILLGILLLEQVVAWMTSYHPAKRRAATP